jgi:hypothetical protein
MYECPHLLGNRKMLAEVFTKADRTAIRKYPGFLTPSNQYMLRATFPLPGQI